MIVIRKTREVLPLCLDNDKSKQRGSNKSGLRVSNHGKMLMMNADIKTRNKFNGNKFNPKKRSCGNKSITASLNVGNNQKNEIRCERSNIMLIDFILCHLRKKYSSENVKEKVLIGTNTDRKEPLYKASKTCRLTNGETNRYFCSFNKFSVLEDVEVDIEHGSDLLNDIKGASLVKNYNNKPNIRNQNPQY